jgi:hypothetical protein
MLNDFLISYQTIFVDHSDNVKYYVYSCIQQYDTLMLTTSDVKQFQENMSESTLKYAPHCKEVKINVLNIIKLG